MSAFSDLFDECRQHGVELEFCLDMSRAGLLGMPGKEYRRVASLRVTRLGRPKGEPLASVKASIDTLDEAAASLRRRMTWGQS